MKLSTPCLPGQKCFVGRQSDRCPFFDGSHAGPASRRTGWPGQRIFSRSPKAPTVHCGSAPIKGTHVRYRPSLRCLPHLIVDHDRDSEGIRVATVTKAVGRRSNGASPEFGPRRGNDCFVGNCFPAAATPNAPLHAENHPPIGSSGLDHHKPAWNLLLCTAPWIWDSRTIPPRQPVRRPVLPWYGNPLVHKVPAGPAEYWVRDSHPGLSPYPPRRTRRPLLKARSSQQEKEAPKLLEAEVEERCKVGGVPPESRVPTSPWWKVILHHVVRQVIAKDVGPTPTAVLGT